MSDYSLNFNKMYVAEIEIYHYQFAIGGEHYYAKIDREDLTRPMTAKDVRVLTKKDQAPAGLYKVGDPTIRFDTIEDIIPVAIEYVKAQGKIILFRGGNCYVEPKEIYFAPDQEVMIQLNKYVEAYQILEKKNKHLDEEGETLTEAWYRGVHKMVDDYVADLKKDADAESYRNDVQRGEIETF